MLPEGFFCAIFLSVRRRYILGDGCRFVRRFVGWRASILGILATSCC